MCFLNTNFFKILECARRVLTLENKAVGATSTRTSNAAIKACVAVLSEASTKPLPLVHASSSALSHRVPFVAPSGSRLAGCFASPPAPDLIAPSAPTDPAFLSTSASCQSVEELQRVATAGFGVYTQLRARGPYPNYKTFLLTARLLSSFTAAAVAAAPFAAEARTGSISLLRSPADAAEAAMALAAEYAASLLTGPIRAKALHQARVQQQQQHQGDLQQGCIQQQQHQGDRQQGCIQQQQQQGDRQQGCIQQQQQQGDLQQGCIQQQLQQTKEQILRQYTPWVHGEAMRTSLLQQDYAGALNMFEALLRLRRQLHRDLSQLLLQEQPSQQHQELLRQREYGRVLLPPLPCGVLDVALRALESSLLAGQPPVWASPSPASVPYFSSHFRPRRQLAQLANGNIASAAILERYLRVQDAPSVRSPTGTASTVTADGTGANLSAIAHAKMRLVSPKCERPPRHPREALKGQRKVSRSLVRGVRGAAESSQTVGKCVLRHARTKRPETQTLNHRTPWLLPSDLQRGDEEHIAKLLARRFGGIEALKIVHRQLQGQKHQPERQQVQEEEHHEQQWSFHESPLNSLHGLSYESVWNSSCNDIFVNTASTGEEWIAKLWCYCLIAVYVQTSELNPSIPRQILLPFPRCLSILVLLGRTGYARAALNLFRWWISQWRSDGRRQLEIKETSSVHTPKPFWTRTQKRVSHAARLLETTVRAAAAAGSTLFANSCVKLSTPSACAIYVPVSAFVHNQVFARDFLNFARLLIEERALDVHAGRWDLSLDAVELFLNARKDLLPKEKLGHADLGPRSLRLHTFHASISRVLHLLASHLATYSLAASQRLQGALAGFDKACKSWCASCGDTHNNTSLNPVSLERLLEEETVFVTLERELCKFRKTISDGITQKTAAASAERVKAPEATLPNPCLRALATRWRVRLASGRPLRYGEFPLEDFCQDESLNARLA
ncbi:uncharacterized protein LOC34619645 [Cyclospora cayetanensis]|uniref:Uncharacterized protein LOC34619645 n=1 Tax=Cyclospora cayetanensis TaxID=88456 RepID=A0A6P6S417_9EIME|nr:uncharacterized protein LOC34619645 [Cyclospora cayetanensis]